MPGRGRRPKKGLLRREMGPRRWGKVDRPKMWGGWRGFARPLLTAGGPENPLLLVLQNEKGSAE